MNISLPNITESKIGIIYVYYERNNQQKNQTNLSFFIKHGLADNKWLNLDIETLIVINGHQCEVIIPNKPNINILTEDNCSDWEGWYNGIKYYENKYKKPIWNIFDYICLIDCGSFGPIYDESSSDHWLIPFYNRMIKYNSVIATPCISFLPNTNPSGIGPRVVPIFSLLRCTEHIMTLIIKETISCKDETSITEYHKSQMLLKFNTHTNSVLGNKYDKQDSVLTGEYGLSRVLIKHGYNVTSLLYDFDCHDEKMWSINNNIEPDRLNSFNGKNIPLNTIFIKNLWRYENSYVSLPVLYNECINYYYEKLKMKSIFDELIITNNYDLLKIDSCDNKYGNWNSKKEYYEKYGYAEEDILFKKPTKDLHGCLIYAHYDSNNMIKDYVIQTINTFRYLGYHILFFTACEHLSNVSVLPCNVFYTKNNGAGTDWKIWLLGCKYLVTNNINFNYVFLLNDSIILPVNGINNFEKTIQNMRSSSDFWGHWDSNEIEWHIIGTPIEFNYRMINDVILFIEQRIPICSSKMDYIIKMK